jgi:hypothetical protein
MNGASIGPFSIVFQGMPGATIGPFWGTLPLDSLSCDSVPIFGKDRKCRPTSDIPGTIAREVPANRSKANEAVTSIFIGANVTPKILLTSNNSLFGAKIYGLR